MTDFEIVIAYTDVVATGHSLIGNYLTVLFAFLVTSYLAADKVSSSIAYIVLALFSLIAVGMIMEIWIIENDLRGMANLIRERVASGSSDLAWHGSASYGWEERITTLKVPSMIGAYLASVVFFLRERTINRDRGGS